MNKHEVFIRRGQLTMVAAAPGCGKSALVQGILQRGNDQGNRNRTLYISADTDATTMWTRAAAITSGYDTSSIERMVREGNAMGLEAEVAKAAGHMQFSYNTSPTDEDLHREVEAYATRYGIYPEVIVMDNLMNLYAGDGDEFQALQGNCDFLHELARDTGAAVITLHHVTGEYENGDKAIPLGGLRGKVSKTPELVLTLYRRGDQLFVCPVKNRTGRASPQASWTLPMYVDLSRMKLMG